MPKARLVAGLAAAVVVPVRIPPQVRVGALAAVVW
jgi:hypothetical protein